MAVEEILRLFDTHWFHHQIFSNNSPTTNPHQEAIEEPKSTRMPIQQVRSLSEQNLSSVPSPPKVQSIVSVKEETELQIEIKGTRKVERRNRGWKNRGISRTSSKSLTDLEFEEVKGFMDLGFVFSAEDKDSKLVSILPGLQRLGKQEETSEEDKIVDDDEKSIVIQRPYLSEAWNIIEKRKVKPLLIDWRVPGLGNELDMKHNLRFWAHTVASTVR